jgi:hypothetical protein
MAPRPRSIPCGTTPPGPGKAAPPPGRVVPNPCPRPQWPQGPPKANDSTRLRAARPCRSSLRRSSTWIAASSVLEWTNTRRSRENYTRRVVAVCSKAFIAELLWRSRAPCFLRPLGRCLPAMPIDGGRCLHLSPGQYNILCMCTCVFLLENLVVVVALSHDTASATHGVVHTCVSRGLTSVFRHRQCALRHRQVAAASPSF